MSNKEALRKINKFKPEIGEIVSDFIASIDGLAEVEGLHFGLARTISLICAIEYSRQAQIIQTLLNDPEYQAELQSYAKKDD